MERELIKLPTPHALDGVDRGVRLVLTKTHPFPSVALWIPGPRYLVRMFPRLNNQPITLFQLGNTPTHFERELRLVDGTYVRFFVLGYIGFLTMFSFVLTAAVMK